MDTRSGDVHIAFSSMRLQHKIPHGAPLWGPFNDSFANYTLTLEEIAEMIYEGRPYTTWHIGRRKRKNFLLGQHLALDFEGSAGWGSATTLGALAQDPFISRYGALLYTTPSHRPPADPRARVLFVLDRPIQRAENQVRAATALLALYRFSDPACKDPCRFYYGSPRCDMLMLDNVLPLDKVIEMIEAHEARQRPAWRPQPHLPFDAARRIAQLAERVRCARQGNRNNELNRQAFLAGLDAARGLLDPDQALQALVAAGLDTGLDTDETYSTAQRAIERGIMIGETER